MLLSKLLKLLYPKGYMQRATGVQETPEVIINCKETYHNVPINFYLIPSIRWCDKKQDYIAVYRIPKNIK